MVGIPRQYTGRFPALNDDIRDPCTLTAEIPDEILEKAKVYVSAEGYDLEVFLQIVWVITLRKYVDTDSLSYALYHTGETKSAVEICQTLISPEDSIEALRKRIEEQDSVNSSSLHLSEVNNGLLISGTASTSDPAVVLNESRMLQKDGQVCEALLVFKEKSESHRLVFIHSTALLSSHQARDVVSTIVQVILELLQGPRQTVGRFNLFSSPNEKLLSEYNGGDRSMEANSPSIIESIQAQVIEKPDATAICASDGDLTYAQLETTSTQLAIHLRSLGVGADVMVPLLFNRCQWVVVAQLAVLKAGGAFVPLDPVHPDAYLTNIIGRVKSTVILTSEIYADRASMLGEKIVCVGHSLISELPNDDNIGLHLLPTPQPNTPAYVLFTSGSTGQPKGCVIQHKAMAQISNQIAIQSIDLSASSRVLQFTSYGFAVSIVEIYYGLCVGATICIPSDHDRMNNLTGAMEEMKVTWSIMTPSLLRTLEPHQKPTNLQTILLAGEPIIKGEFDGWDAIVDLVQVYGASENCGLIGFTNPQLDVMAFHPFPNFRFWIVEATDHHSLAPAGTVGELILEGPSLARGYLNDPLTTSSAFVDTTVWRQSKVVPGNAPRNLYKTGDLFCYSQYGGIRYAGRTALDVKIRGKRIDLKEVEYNVRQCCVDATRAIAVTAPPADANQVAVLVVFLHSPRYISAKGENSEAIFAASSEAFQSEVHTIQAKLVETMPDHMLPTFYIPLAFIPMTVTGKVDMSILRNCVQKATRAELEAYQSSAVVEMVQPATETEKCLHDVFSQVLGVNGSSFGVHHSFIRLGGDSLSAMRVVALCQSRNYPEVTVAEILGQQTIRKLAQNLDISTERKSSSMVPPPIFSLLPGVDQDKKDAVVKYTAEKCSVSIDAIQDIYPCTALQEGLMVSTIKAQDMYIARCIFDLSSGTDLEQLKAAWQTTVDANVMLRTRIVQSPSDGMIQAVLCQDQSIIQWASFSSIGEYHNEDRASSMGPGEPLARFSLIGDPSSGLSLALTLHHAIFDRYSLGLLLTQAHRAYSGEVLEPNIFSPFIQTIQRQDNLAGHEFWKDIFADLQAPTFPSLPHDMALPMATAHLEQTVTLPLQMDSGITLSNIARLAWAIVVSVHADSADVTFGVTVNGRATPTPGVEEMAGPTIATVPFRVRCNQEDTVADALAAIQSLAIRMIAYEQTGLQNIRQISPEAASACEFQSQLVFQQPEQSPTDQDSQIMKGRTAQHGMEDLSVFINYAIGLVCTPSAGNQSLHLDVYFDRNILPEAMANRLVTQFANILQQLCANQNQRIDQLDLVSPQDLAVMIKRNGISLPMEYPGTLHGLILQNAQDEPLAPAVSSWDKSLTYQDLEALSNNLGHEIIQAGVKPGDRVALCFEKSIWPVLSMLSVLRAGAIGVNIDPSLPPVRIAAILQVAEPSLVLTSAGTHPIVQSVQSRIPIMEISSRTQSTEPTAETKKVVEWPSVKPDDVAFIIFTSGTTGTPKGIVIEHRHFTTALHYHRDTMGAYPGMRALHFCSYAWDMGVHEVFYTWVHGGCLCIPSETQRMSNLAGFIREHRVNWALMTPSASTILNPDEVPGLTTLLVGGELIPIELMETWSSRLRMINLYGQAETLMVCATGQIEPSSVHCPGRVGPLMGTAGWITTPGDVSRLAPLGTIGELLLEGPMVSRGYFNEPEKTRQAFIEAPAWLRKVRPDGSTGRIYRTGDLAWFDDDGILHFVGRKDTQVKLRGQRIILSDIQHQIQLHFASAQQVVAEVIRPQHSTSALLVAFIYQGSTEDNGDKSQILQDPDEVFLQHSASVIATLQDSLPAHMIPTAMFPIHYVPYGATLKIDRRKLREQAEQLTPDRLQSYAMGENSRDTQKEPPKTSSEVMWQGLWAQVLSIPVDRIGRDDHLFRMGGDSLMAIKLVALAHREGLPHITFQDVFEHPRLRDIAAVSTVSSSISASPQDSPGPAPFALVQDVDILIQMASDQCHISVDTIEDIYPCTPLQSSLIASTVHHRDAYMLLQSYTLSDGVNAERLEKAWESTAETHPILRTRIFQTPAGTSYQAVLRGPLEWSHLEADDSTPSHPIVGLGTPLIKLILSPRRLLLSIHHAVYDGWSLNLLASQVEKTYNDLSAQSPALFNRFIQHVEGSMDSAALFWRNELQDADPVQFPALPSLNFQPNPQSTIDKIITLPENTKQDNATLASKIKLAWALVSSTYSKNNDVIVGVVSSGRTAPVADIDRIMGPTIATVPLRVRLDPRKKVCEALEQLQAKFAEQAPYEHFGLQQISQQGDNAAAACQFQTLIAVEPKQPKDQFSSEKQAWYRDAKILSDTTHFSSHALMLQCETLPGGSTIELTATFDADVLPVGQMQRVLSQFEYFLMQVQDVSDTTATTIGDLQVVSPQDLEELMRWNSLPSLADDYVDSCVHELVHRQCQRQPDAQAIHAWDGDFTYKELDDHSTRLASHIQALALVRPDTFVALYFEKSRWTVVAQLAVLKAGGAFTMFDPSHPLQRLQEICSTIQPPLILTSEDQKEYAAGAFHVPVVGVGHALVREGSLCLDCDGSIVMPNNAMYAISTSGTTGKPKVVVIEHRCFVANRDPMIEMLGLTPYSRVFQFSGYSFDAMLVEHFATLLAGGCICIPSKFDRDNFLEKAITEMRANWAVLTTSVIQLLSPSTVPTIKTLVQAGEPMNQSIIDRWASHVRLGNAYGPAENTIFTCASIDIEPDANPNVIGQAKGCATWIVDPATLDLVPIGAEGELIIEGETVGRGYLNDPERTAAAFTSKPSWLKQLRGCVSDKPVYRTGDLVKYTPDGSICYVRRKDLQIKLRGQRLELADVEHHVQRCFPGALQVVATVISLNNSNPAVVALVLSSSAPVQPAADNDLLLPATSNGGFLKAAQTAELALHERVPAYMIPKVFLPLSRIPRNINGKVDRHQIDVRLASLTRQEVDSYNASSNVIVPPENDLQNEIRAIWAVVLSIAPEEIGIRNSFFRIGGDSITSMQVVAQCRTSRILITMQDLFKHRTIEELAAHVSQSNPKDAAEVDQPEQFEIFDKEMDLSPIQQMYFDSAPKNPNHFVQSLILRLERNDLDAESIARALDTVVHTHSMLRARFKKSPDGKWTQSIPANGNGKHYRYHDCGIQSQEEIEIICHSRQQTLDIQNGPLFVVDQFERDNDGTHWLNLMAHHLIVDLVSWRVILADLEQILTTGSAPKVPPTPFLHWCQLQADYATSSLPAVLDKDDQDFTAYWGDEATNHNTHQDVDTYTISLDQETSRVLLGSANEPLGTQPVEIIQAAVLHSFVQLFPDRSAPVIFSEGHGREPWDPTIDITRTVGWFTTIWPTQVDLQVSEGMVTALRRTKDARRNTPANGWEYFTSCYLHPQGPKTKKTMEIILNYQGRYQQLERADALFKFDGTNKFGAGNEVEDMPRFSLLDVSAQVTDDSLHLQFIINRRMKHQDRLKQWAGQCAQSLREASAQLSTMQGRHPTVSDFPLLTNVQSDQLHGALTDLSLKLDGQEIEAIYPTSPIQRGILMSQARNTHHYQQVIRWKVLSTDPAAGVPVQIEELGRAWQRVVNRHPALRTVFLEITDGVIDQVVLKNVSAAIQWDFTLLEPNNDRICPSSVLHLETSTQGEITLNLHMNHALFDGPSERILRRELALAYGNDNPMLPATSYQDYVAYLCSVTAAGNDDEVYWRGYLDSSSPCLFPRLLGDAHSDQNQEAIEEFGSFLIDVGSTTAVEDFCEEHRIALTSVYHVVWAIVLSCYTGATNICFGYISSGRSAPVPGIQEIVGPVINLLIGQLQLEQEAPLMSVLQQYHESRLNSLEHQHHSLGETLNAIGASSSELFNTAISIQDRRKGVSDSEPLSTIALIEGDGEDRSEYPITLNVAVFEETAKLLISYQKSFLAPKYAVAIGQAFAHVMSQVLSQPHQAIREIELLNHEQRAEIEIRNALVPEAVTTLVHHTIQQRCLEQPSAQAVCAWDGDFTFNELNQLSSNLAEELVDHGVGVESPIALYLEKSRWTPVAILGVLKAGATFVLLDASHPSARLQTICEDSQSSLVLASSSLLSKATDLSSCVIEIGDRLLTYRTLTVRSQTVEVSSNNAAYIVFTSGSTGKPKGIVVDHSSLSTSLQSLLSRCDITSTTRLLQFASHAFDIAVLDLLLALIAGGCVCIPSDAERTSDITCAMNRMRVTCAVTTPTVARMFDLDELPHFKALCLGGESVSTADLMMWHNKVRTISLYGPAECTLACTAGEPMTMASNPRNIGFGSGCVPWIVDRSDYRRLVPDGVVGELLLEGPIVARGYLNNPPQTSVSFVKPPSWLAALRAGGPPPRLYKTGDMVRYAEDGSLIFVGRTDDQVKIRGQRLELGEVEVQVSSAFSEDHVLVELVNRSGFPVLVAFVLQSHLEEAPRGSYGSLLHPPSKAFYDSIRSGISHLKMTMPSYMIPSAFLPLATLPKGSTGKTDRRRLREHAASLSEVELEAYIIAGMSRRAPSTPLETRLQELVARSLNKPTANIPLDEDVFQIGMDSMKAMQLVAAGRRDGVRFSVQMLFQYPRLSDLAAALKQKTDIDRTPVKPSPLLEFADEICAEWCLDPSEVVNIAPATYYQRDMIKIHHLAHISIHFSRPIDQARLQSAFVATIERHPVLRTIFVPFQQTFVQVVLRHVDLAVEDISTDEDPKDALQSICRADAESPPPFGKPTLFLFVVTGRGRQSISLRMNHAHYDGMTIYLMMQEVAARYADSKSVFPYSLTHPDFVAHRVQRITPATHQFWRDLLQDSSMTYLDENDNGMGRPDRMRLDLLASCSGDMPMPDLQDGITIATAIKAAWSLCLAQYSNSNDVVFAQVSTNRALDIEGIDRMLGPGVNYIAVRVTLQPDWTAKELFRWVQDQHIRAMSYDTVDWDDMVAQSTSWPKDTPIGTGVHYINAPPLWNHDYLFNDEVPARNEHIDFKALHSYPMLLCVPLPATDNGPPRLGISLSSLTFSQDVAEKLFSLFRETVVRLTTYPEDLVCPV